MAQEVKLMGATYSDVPAILLPDSNDVMHQFDDTTDATATAADISTGKTAYVNGEKVTGTNSGGGDSAWTKIAETSYQVSTTQTTAITVATFATGHSEIWTSDKLLYIRVRDTVGKRANYFYGTDAFFWNYTVKNGSSSTSTGSGLVMNHFYVSRNNKYSSRYGYNTTGYGVYPNSIGSNGDICIAAHYNKTYSLTIDSTYSVEVYLLDPPTGAPIFE